MRLRVKDRSPRLLDHRLHPMEMWRQDDGYYDVTLPLYGLYRLTRYGSKTVEYIEFSSAGVSAQRVDHNNKVIGTGKVTVTHDGFENIYTVE